VSLDTDLSNPARANPESMSSVLTIAETKSTIFDQPLEPTPSDDGVIKTRSTTFVLQFDSALWQTYNIIDAAHCSDSLIIRFRDRCGLVPSMGWVHPWVGLGWTEVFGVCRGFGWVGFSDTVMVGSNDCTLLFFSKSGWKLHLNLLFNSYRAISSP